MPWFDPGLAPLALRLRHLRIASSQMGGGLVDDLLRLSALTAPVSWRMERGCRWIQVRGWLGGVAGAQLAVQAAGLLLPSLLHRQQAALFPHAPSPWQVAGAQLRGCAYGPADAAGGGPACLTLRDPRLQAAQLAGVLAALLPAGRPCARLHIVGGSHLAAAAAQQGGSGWLGQLVELRLEGCATAAEVLQCVLPQAPRLTHLAFAPGAGAHTPHPGQPSGSSAAQAGGAELPPRLVASRELRRLELRGTLLGQLPAGPFLTGGLRAGMEQLHSSGTERAQATKPACCRACAPSEALCRWPVFCPEQAFAA